MIIDNTAFTMYMRCPKMFFERYEGALDAEMPRLRSLDVGREDLPILQSSRGIELRDETHDSREFGKRFHKLVEHRRLSDIAKRGRDADSRQRSAAGASPTSGTVPSVCGLELQPVRLPDDALSAECEALFAAYEAHYLPEPLEFLEAERTHIIDLPASKHQLAVKIDGVVRFPDGTIGPLDTKTQESGSSNNSRENWAGRTQASLYLWALKELYPGESVSRLVVDVATRSSPKRGPVFYRIDDITRTQAQLDESVKNVLWVCEDVEASRRSGFWRSNMNICKDGWKRCDYYDLHVYGRTPENLAKFKPAEVYLDL